MSTFLYLGYNRINSIVISLAMSKRKFREDQINDLLDNKNVTKCSDKAITYSTEFKVRAVQQYLVEGVSAKEIFREAGFDLLIIGTDTAKRRLSDWRRIYKVKGSDGLVRETRGRLGGRPKLKGLTETEKIARLEAEVAYLKAENHFLARLRAKRAE